MYESSRQGSLYSSQNGEGSAVGNSSLLRLMLLSGNVLQLRLSGQNLVQCPLDAMGSILNHLYLLGVGSIRRKGDCLQGIADVVIHGGDNFQAIAHGPVAPLLIGEDKQACQGSRHKIIGVGSHPTNFMLLEKELKKGSEQKDAEP